MWPRPVLGAPGLGDPQLSAAWVPAAATASALRVLVQFEFWKGRGGESFGRQCLEVPNFGAYGVC